MSIGDVAWSDALNLPPPLPPNAISDSTEGVSVPVLANADKSNGQGSSKESKERWVRYRQLSRLEAPLLLGWTILAALLAVLAYLRATLPDS
jgi:hypothetical protein